MCGQSITKRSKNEASNVAFQEGDGIIAQNHIPSYHHTLFPAIRAWVCEWLSHAWQLANTPIPHTPCAGILLVVGVLMFVGACWVLPLLAQSNELVINGGFESGTSPWAPCTGVIETSSNAHSGSTSLSLHWGHNGWHYCAYQDVGTLIAGHQYQFSFWAKSGNYTWAKVDNISNSKSNYSGLGYIEIPSNNGAYMYYSMIFTVITETSAYVSFNFSPSTDATLIDDVSLVDLNIPVNPSSCIVSDPGFSSSSSWTPNGDATYSSGQWQLQPEAIIYQSNVSFIYTSIYTATIVAKADTTSRILLDVMAVEHYPITITSSSFGYYYVSLIINTGLRTVILNADQNNTGSVIVDSICFNPSQAPPLPQEFANCSLNDSDLSTTLFQNGSLDSGWGYYNFAYGGQLWFPTAWEVGFIALDRVPGFNFSNHAIGLVPQLTSGYVGQQLVSPANRFNLVMMVKRTQANATINVSYNDGSWWNPTYIEKAVISDTTLNEWQPVAVWFDQGESKRWKIALSTTCPGCSSYNSGYDVDEIYAIPGTSALTCSVSPPPPSPQPIPVGGCINGNPHMNGPDNSYQMTYGGAVDGVGYPWIWNWHGRMGMLTPWEHVARLWPTSGYDAYVQQYVGAAYGDVSREYSGMLVGRQYDVFGTVIGYQQPNEMGPIQASTATVAIGNTSGSGLFSFDVTVDANQPSHTFWQTFTATQGMLAGPCSSGELGGCNINVLINNRGGTSALIDLACVRPISTTSVLPPVNPPTGTGCIGSGSWVSSGGGALGYTAPGDYIRNTTDINGTYRLWIVGESEGPGALLAQYINTTTGITVALGSLQAVVGNNSINTTFTTPPTGYFGGQIRIKPQVGITITEACLQANAIPPIIPPDDTPTPIVVPFPSCGSINFAASSPYLTNTIGFYVRPPYTETTILSGTLYSDVNWAEYAAMQTYNYAIYPLVCTTISIANWQVDAYNALMQLLTRYFGLPQGNTCGTGIWAVLCELIRGLVSIVGQIVGLLQSLLDLIKLILQIIAALVGMLLYLLQQLLSLIFSLLSFVVDVLGYISNSIRGTEATGYTPTMCNGDTEPICLGLGVTLVINQYAGQYITPIVYLLLAALTIWLINYAVGQVRAIMQPGDEGSD